MNRWNCIFGLTLLVLLVGHSFFEGVGGVPRRKKQRKVLPEPPAAPEGFAQRLEEVLNRVAEVTKTIKARFSKVNVLEATGVAAGDEVPAGYRAGGILTEEDPETDTYWEGPYVVREKTGKKVVHGVAKAMYVDEKTYLGDVVLGQLHGLGILTLNYKERFAGEWQRGAEEGVGNRTFHNGWYAGEWVNGHAHGVGRRHWTETNDLFDGLWQDGKSQGYGIMRYGNGDNYTGLWQDGKEHGQGRYYHADTREWYSGEWHQGTPQGQGTYLYASGDYYVGQWHNGTAHGIGKTIYSKTGDFWYGYMKNGEKHGRGEYHMPEADLVVIGKWRHGHKKEAETQIEALNGRKVGFFVHKLDSDKPLSPTIDEDTARQNLHKGLRKEIEKQKALQNTDQQDIQN